MGDYGQCSRRDAAAPCVHCAGSSLGSEFFQLLPPNCLLSLSNISLLGKFLSCLSLVYFYFSVISAPFVLAIAGMVDGDSWLIF